MPANVTQRGGTVATAAVILALLLCGVGSAWAQQKPEQLAQKSAETWLALVDPGKYAESWDEAAQLFKAAVGKTNGKACCTRSATRWAKRYRETSRARLIPGPCLARQMATMS